MTEMYEEKTRGTRRTQGFINQTKRLYMHVFSVLCVYTFLGSASAPDSPREVATSEQ